MSAAAIILGYDDRALAFMSRTCTRKRGNKFDRSGGLAFRIDFVSGSPNSLLPKLPR